MQGFEDHTVIWKVQAELFCCAYDPARGKACAHAASVGDEANTLLLGKSSYPKSPSG